MSSFFTLPNTPDVPNYEFEVPLDDVLFRMRFKFNARDSFWYMDLSNGVTGAILRAGIKIVSQWDLLRLYQEEGRPTGKIVPMPLGEAGTEATTLAQLGADVLMIYAGES